MLPFLLVAVVVSAIAAISDVKSGRIPNWLTLGAIVLGVVGHFICGWSTDGLRTGLYQAAFSLGGLAFCALAPFVMYWKGAMGGGDLKLFAAIGALCHPMLGIESQMYALIIAAVAAPARLAYEGRLFRVIGDSFAMLLNPFRPVDKRRVMPREAMTWFRLGPAIFGGVATTFLIHVYAVASP